MARPKRLNLPFVPQHVVQRGNNRQNCFYSESDYRVYLKLLEKRCDDHKCHLHAYVLMTNHVHMLITPQVADGVSLLFRDLGRDYVRRINRKYGRTGTLWEGRFKSSLVDSDEYCLACYRYIELNPVRAGMVDHPGMYPWSSYSANTTMQRARLITPHETWLELGRTASERRAAYRRLFASELSSDQLRVIRRGAITGKRIGDMDLQEQIDASPR